MASEGTSQRDNGRLVANSRPVAHPAAPRRSPVSGRPAQVRRREDARRRHQASKRGLSRSPSTRSAAKGRRLASSSVSVGGLNISARMIVGLLIVAVIAIVLIPTLLQWGDMQREYRAAVADGEAATAQEERLQAELDNWENPEFIAAQARARLGYVDPGETRYAVIDAPPQEGVPAERDVTEDWPPKPWNLRLTEQLMDVDSPPAVREAAQVETVTLAEDPAEGSGEDW